MSELKRNHRTLGRVISETPDGFTILQTGDHQFIAVKSGELLPVTDNDAEFDLRMQLAAIVERARFLGVPMERVEELLRSEAA